MSLAPLQTGYTCSRPFYDLLVDTVSNPTLILDWVFCPYTIGGLGLAGVGLIVLATGFVGLKNWSEGFVLPMAWLALVGPVLATAMLPGNVIRRAVGFIVLAFMMSIIGVYYWWGRS